MVPVEEYEQKWISMKRSCPIRETNYTSVHDLMLQDNRTIIGFRSRRKHLSLVYKWRNKNLFSRISFWATWKRINCIIIIKLSENSQSVVTYFLYEHNYIIRRGLVRKRIWFARLYSSTVIYSNKHHILQVGL